MKNFKNQFSRNYPLSVQLLKETQAQDRMSHVSHFHIYPRLLVLFWTTALFK